ncbi:hypothetical protein [Streptomyces sp. E2N171]|uniref:hypothetical protein n=1 Tax=Streptomyces sp. E2N171 TaxID=1851914 RepID=UPI000EF583A5|nr:hypothetical protein [Streptomyces sp. E2N171]
MISRVDHPAYPNADRLPADVAKLVAARDAAMERLSDFEDANADVLSDSWQTIAESKDIKAAVAAAEAGKDAFAGASEMTRAREARPRMIGVQQVLRRALNKAERAANRAVLRAAEGMEPGLRSEVESAAEAAEAAYQAYLTARGALGGAAARLRAVRLWAAGEWAVWTDGEASPMRTDGAELRAENPLMEIREVVASLDTPLAVTPDPLIKVRRTDGEVFELRRSQAKALTGHNIREGQRLVIIGDDESEATDGDA